MGYDFDRVIDRTNTNSLKFDFAVERGRPADVLPLWVADMDFQTAPCVREALTKAVDHGIFGYSEHKPGYFDAVAGWFDRQFGYTPQPEWLIKTPGVVYALAAAVRCYTEVGDSVLILSPVYYPFSEVVRDNDRALVESQLVYENGAYHMDFADMEQKIAENNVKLLLFCSPHNPVGRVWTRAELEQVVELCEKYDVLIVSDEIHCDFVWPGHRHIVLPTIRDAAARRTILCTAPSKTFNIATLQISNVFIADPELRQKFQQEKDRSGYSQVGGLGLVACEAAYRGGLDWLTQVRQYIWDNFNFLRETLERELPRVKLVQPEGTYLAWLDCSGLGLGGAELTDFITNRAKLWLDAGAIFGEESAQFQRINVACPRETLSRALKQLINATKNL